MIKEYWIYMLECDNGSLYTGYTTDMKRRIREHVDKNRGAKFTSGFRPIATAACWRLLGTRSEALKVEAFIKSMSRKEKDELIKKPRTLASKTAAVLPGVKLYVHKLDKKDRANKILQNASPEHR